MSEIQLKRIAEALTQSGMKGADVYGKPVKCITEAVWEVAAVLARIEATIRQQCNTKTKQDITLFKLIAGVVALSKDYHLLAKNLTGSVIDLTNQVNDLQSFIINSTPNIIIAEEVPKENAKFESQ